MNQFQRTRRDHALERAEDYVEMVKHLTAVYGRARVTDLAKELHVRSATVTQMVKKLHEEGYLDWQPYGAINLTAKGEALAEASRERHQVVTSFLLALGVGQETAEHDSEGMEHHVSEETLAAMKNHLSKLAKDES